MSTLHDITFYLTTYKRPDRQTTFMRSGPIQNQIVFVVQESEADYMKRLYPDNDFVVLPSEITRLSPTRQYLIGQCPTKKMILLDDDLKFYVRKSPTDWHLRYTTDNDLIEMYENISEALDHLAHVGISPREGNNRVEEFEKENTRIMRVLAYRVDIIRKIHAKFDRLNVMSDFDMNLQLLKAGYESTCFYHWAQGQDATNYRGGCSAYRTEEVHNEAAEGLHELHPGFVKLRMKKNKTGGLRERKEVTIYWKKAIASSGKEGHGTI